uniref:Uncharacterized protein n=1 Tax=Tanacetum cinerariifolium TaxID=118510 RepID=A0A699IIZ8_TANCI|nr:hypothetical protein [Tanacetum cinerariifolium]
MCAMVGQLIQKKQEEKQIEEEQSANARYWKIFACYDDDDDYNSAITPNEPVDSLNKRDEHLNTVLAMELDEFINSCVENLIPNPSESKGENGCDVPACFTTFSNVLFDADYEFDSVDDQSLHDEDFLKEIYSNPLFEEEIISMKIDQHHFNVESDLIESLPNRDSSIILSFLKIDSLLDEFADELTLLKSIPPGVDETDCYPEEDIRLTKILLYNNSSPHPPEEFVSENSNADIESFSPSPIPIKDIDSFMEEIDLSFTPDEPMSPGIEEDDYDSERDILILVQYSRKIKDSWKRILSSKSSFPQLHVGNKMHKAFPLPVMEFPLPVKKVPTARRKEMPLLKYKTAQELWAAILKTFGGNEATKKTKMNILKQQYGNFKAEGSETLEQTFNRLQVIVSQLQFMDVEIKQDDLNQKFLTSLAPKWLMHTIVWRNRSDLDTMSLDDMGNEEVNTASVSTASTNVPTANANIGVIDEDDMEEIDIKWNMALLCMRADRAPRSQDRGRRYNYRQGSKVEEQALKTLMAIDGVGWDWSYMANDEENHALVADKEAPIEFALVAKTSAESKVFDNSLCSKDCKKNTDSLNSKITDLTDKLFDAKNMIYHYKLGLAQVESRLAEHRDRELKYCKKIRGLEFKTESCDDYIKSLKKELDLIKKEKDGLDSKLTGFQTASIDIDSLLESQRLDKNKEGLGYSVIPPPPAQIYSPPKKDMSWTGLPEFKDDTVTDYSRHAPTIESSPDDAQNKNSSATKTEALPTTISPKSFIKFVKANDSTTNSKTDKVETAKKPPVKAVPRTTLMTKAIGTVAALGK